MDHLDALPVPDPNVDRGKPESRAPHEVERAVELLVGMLRTDVHVGATLLPGYVIAPKPMTPAERAARFLPRANEKRHSDNQERLASLKLEIARQLASAPTMTNFDLAVALNEAGLRTYTGLPFTATRVGELLRRLRLAAVEQLRSAPKRAQTETEQAASSL